MTGKAGDLAYLAGMFKHSGCVTDLYTCTLLCHVP